MSDSIKRITSEVVLSSKTEATVSAVEAQAAADLMAKMFSKAFTDHLKQMYTPVVKADFGEWRYLDFPYLFKVLHEGKNFVHVTCGEYASTDSKYQCVRCHKRVPENIITAGGLVRDD